MTRSRLTAGAVIVAAAFGAAACGSSRPSDQHVAACLTNALNNVSGLYGCDTSAANTDGIGGAGVSSATCTHSTGDQWVCTDSTGANYTVTYDGGSSIVYQPQP